MFKILICCCLISVVFGSEINFNKNNNVKNNNVNASIVVVEKIGKKFIKSNPSLELNPLNKINNFDEIRYSLGRRVSGDTLVAYGEDGAQWSTPQNVKLNLQYPRSGTGARVSFIEILVDQSSDIGTGYVIGGGIGQRQISVVIEAGSTYHFKYSFAIYGLN